MVFFLSTDRRGSLVDKREVAKETHLKFSKTSSSIIHSLRKNNPTKWSKHNHDWSCNSLKHQVAVTSALLQCPSVVTKGIQLEFHLECHE